VLTQEALNPFVECAFLASSVERVFR